MLSVSEIFLSIQGESTRCGRVCSFVRLFGCNLRCVWCDTRYARGDGGGPVSPMSVADVVDAIGRHYSGGGEAGPPSRLVEITGGEPLLQPDTAVLCAALLERGYEVMAETNGSLDIGLLPPGVRRVVDVKCPGSGEGRSFLTGNIRRIGPGDELKFVTASIDDAVWAADFCYRHCLAGRCPITFSPAAPLLPFDALAEWMLEARPAGVRLGVQLHRVIWGDDRRGV